MSFTINLYGSSTEPHNEAVAEVFKEAVFKLRQIPAGTVAGTVSSNDQSGSIALSTDDVPESGPSITGSVDLTDADDQPEAVSHVEANTAASDPADDRAAEPSPAAESPSGPPESPDAPAAETEGVSTDPISPLYRPPGG